MRFMSFKTARLRNAALLIAAIAAMSPAAHFGLYKQTLAEIGPPLSLTQAQELSATVTDRDDRLLRPFTTSDGRWRLPLDPHGVDQRYLKILFAFEDQHFYQHHGVDGKAVGRAVLQFLRHGRLVSGASTLTMQVARLVDGKHERTGAGKLRQMARALQLEHALSKNEILRLYLQLATWLPFQYRPVHPVWNAALWFHPSISSEFPQSGFFDQWSAGPRFLAEMAVQVGPILPVQRAAAKECAHGRLRPFLLWLQAWA